MLMIAFEIFLRMQFIFNIILIVLAGLLVTSVMLQQRGSGLGNAFGGDSNAYTTKRGAEKVLFVATIIIAILFFGTAIVNLLLR